MSADAGVAERLDAVRSRIAEACSRSGRSVDEVNLIGASKSQPSERLQEAFEAGLRLFGENRVQEAEAKRPALPAAADWHLIGPLQSNKAKKAVDLFSTIHSIDRVKIARAVDREAARRGFAIRGFLEINLAGEPSKHGLAPEALAEAARPLAELEHLRLVGLMAIPPQESDPHRAHAWFRRLRELRDDLFSQPEWQGRSGWLSMGMSGDFEIAIEEGATHVRVGTALFGPRSVPTGGAQ